jgi:hypothetical protein
VIAALPITANGLVKKVPSCHPALPLERLWLFAFSAMGAFLLWTSMYRASRKKVAK